MKVEALISAAAQQNRTLSDMLRSDATLEELLSAQAARWRKNQSVKPLQSPGDFLEACRDYLTERIGEDANRALPALRMGILHTADHHGGLYSPQSFQGDLLLSALFQRLGEPSGVIPVFSFSQAPLGNATHARGILCFPDSQAPCSVPLFGRLQDNQMVFSAPGYNREQLRKASIRAQNHISEGATRETVLNLLAEVYDSPAIREQERYAEQVFFIGLELSRRLFGGRKLFLYIEAEEILRNLLPKDLANPDSLLYRVLTSGRIRREMNKTPLENGQPVSACLFHGADRKGRRVLLNLDADGVFRGKSLGGGSMEFSGNPERLSEEIKQRRLLPAVPAAALALAWARGLTWFGGVFQSLYLPAWQRIFADLLDRARYPSLGEAVRPWDCSGYLSGSVYVLSPVTGGAVHAGPVEFLARPERAARLSEEMNVSVRDSHIMGMFELYHDLIPGRERQEGWYEAITDYVGKHFPNRVL